jgi:hypothetical protein
MIRQFRTAGLALLTLVTLAAPAAAGDARVCQTVCVPYCNELVICDHPTDPTICRTQNLCGNDCRLECVDY